jgi:hypothetical protein
MSETGDINQLKFFTITVAVTGVLYFMFLTYVVIQAEQYAFQIVKENNYKSESCSITPSVRCLTVKIKSVTQHENVHLISFGEGEPESSLINIVNRNIQVTAWVKDKHFILQRFTEEFRNEGNTSTGNQLIAHVSPKPESNSINKSETSKDNEIIFPWKSDFGLPYFTNGLYTICVISRY